MIGPCVPWEYQPGKHRGPIIIGEHVLTGARVTILPDVTIPDGVAVGAHSLVKESCEAWMMYAGVPAKLIRPRHKNILALCKQFEASLGLAD